MRSRPLLPWIIAGMTLLPEVSRAGGVPVAPLSVAFEPSSDRIGVVWREGPRVEATLYDQDAQATGGRLVVTTTTSVEPDAAIAAEPARQRFVIAYSSGSELSARVLQPDGTLAAPLVVDAGLPGDVISKVAISVDEDRGELLVLWQVESATSAENLLRARRIGGTPLAAVGPVHQIAAHASAPTAVYGGGGHVALYSIGSTYYADLRRPSDDARVARFALGQAQSGDTGVAHDAARARFLWARINPSGLVEVVPFTAAGVVHAPIAMFQGFDHATIAVDRALRRAAVASARDPVDVRFLDLETDTALGVGPFSSGASGEYARPAQLVVDSDRHRFFSAYHQLSPASVVRLLPLPGICTSLDAIEVTEGEALGVVDVRLCAQPSDNVILEIASSTSTQAFVLPVMMTFTPNGWDQAQSLAVQAIVDQVPDGDVPFRIFIRVLDANSAPEYRGLTCALPGVARDGILAICGNGLVEQSEGCDDMATAAGDGCSAACVVEPGWTCTGEPSLCQRIAVPDAGAPDLATPDLGAPDSGALSAEAGVSADAAVSPVPEEEGGCGCASTPRRTAWPLAAALAALTLRRRARGRARGRGAS